MPDPNLHERVPYGAPGRRVAVVAGLRTPFAKANSALARISATELGRRCVAELLARADVDPKEVQAVVYGSVLQNVQEPNIAREISLMPQLPKGAQSFTVSRACASANQAITDAATRSSSATSTAWSPAARVAVAGAGAPLAAHERRARVGGQGEDVRRARAQHRHAAAQGLHPGHAGHRRAEHRRDHGAERREDGQAQRRHARRAGRVGAALAPAGRAGWTDGRLAEEVAPVFLPGADGREPQALDRDNGVRADTSLERLAKLAPVFDKRYGSVTAGNSSPLTDGASAVLLMREDKARALGYEPLAYLRSYAYAALDPGEQLLQGPALAMPVALARAGVGARDVDLFEIHEAFAAQVLCNLKAFASRAWAERAGFASRSGSSTATAST
jgi:acetyl-CoA acyltransferase